MTTLLARRLLEQVPGGETAWAVVPVVNPDGLLAGIRQNAAGVDLNRNFPAATWRPTPRSRTRRGSILRCAGPENRTNRSSPGHDAGIGAGDAGAGRARAAAAAGARRRPAQPARAAARPQATSRRRSVELLAGSADLPVVDELPRLSRAPSTTGSTRPGFPAIVYEIEHDGLPGVCARHLPGLTALLRGEALWPRLMRRRGGCRYSTRMTAARLCVVSCSRRRPLERARGGRDVAVVAADGDRDVARPGAAVVRRIERHGPDRAAASGTSTSTQACVPPSPSR